MSIFLNFIQKQLLAELEQEFVKHAPDVQSAIVAEVAKFANEAFAWVESKVKSNPSLNGAKP